MKKKFFYSFIILSIFFFENKPSWIKSFSSVENNLIRIKKLYEFSQSTHEFFKEYYRERNKNIKKILFCSAVLIFSNNHSKKSLKDIFKKESIKQSFCSSAVRLTGCSIIHFTEGLFSYMTLKEMKLLPIYRDRRGISLVFHEFNIDKEDKAEELNDSKNYKNNISKSEIRSLNSNKQTSSQIRSDNPPSSIEILTWQKQFLTDNHTKRETKLIEQVETSEEELKKLKVKTTKYSEDLESKINQIEEITRLMDANHNEIIRLKKEVQFLETNKNKEFDHLKNEYEKQIITLKNQLLATNENFAQAQAQAQAQLEKKYTQEKENNIIEIRSSLQKERDLLTKKHEKEILCLNQNLDAMQTELMELEIKEKLNKEKQDNLAKTIEQKEKVLFILGLEVEQKNQSVKNLKEQFNKLNNCWKEAKEKNNKEAKASSLSKIDLRPLNNDLPSCVYMSPIHRLEQIREQLVPPASL